MGKLEKAYKFSMLVLVLLPFALVWFVLARQQGPTPVDARPVGQIIEADQKAYDKLTGPGKKGVEPDKAFIRALKPDKPGSRVLEYDLSSSLTKPVKMDVYDIYDEVAEVDLDNPPADAGYIKPLCLGVAKSPIPHGAIGPSRYSGPTFGPMTGPGHPASLSFYDFDRRPLTEAQVKGLGVEYNGSTYMSDTTVLKVFYSIENMPGARLVDSRLIEARNLHQISRQVSDMEDMGYPPPVPKEGAAGVCSFYQNVLFPAELRWVADVAYEPQIVDLPLEMGAEADFEDALVRVVSDEIVTDSMRPDMRMDRATFQFRIPSPGTQKMSHVIAAQTPRSSQRLITYQFLDVDKNPLEPEYNAESDYESWNFAIMSHHNPTTTKAKYLRIRKYAAIRRFVMDIGRLPGTPPENDDVEDLMELQIPVFSVNNYSGGKSVFGSYLMLDNIRGIDVLDYQNRHSGESGTVTPRVVLQSVVRSELSPKSVLIDWKNGGLYVRDYAGWMDKLSEMLGGK